MPESVIEAVSNLFTSQPKPEPRSAKEISWLAGLLEGEGCFHYAGPNKVPAITLNMIDRDVVTRARDLLISRNPITPLRKGNFYISKTTTGKPLYRVTITGYLAFQWMLTLYCLMGERRQAKMKEIVLNYSKKAHRKVA